MKLFLRLIIGFLLVSLTLSSGYNDRVCVTAKPKEANIWLDMVIVVDNSRSMADYNWDMILHYGIEQSFGGKQRIGTNQGDPMTTRVGFVTYNKDATIVADLNKFQSFDDLNQTAYSFLSSVSDISESYLARGLQAAEQVLQSGRSNGYRSNYQQLIIVYTALYQGIGDLDPMPVANRLKNNGITITVIDTISVCGEHIDPSNKLPNIASEDFYDFICTNTPDFLYVAQVETNCFCKDAWIQYGADNFYKRGICVKVFSSEKTSWLAAKVSCQNTITNGYLAPDFDTEKHKFLINVFKNTTGLLAGYHIGLNFLNGKWYWQQPTGQPLVPLDSSYWPNTPWFWGWPKSSTTNTSVATVLQDINGADVDGWENINPYTDNQYYICEVDACSVDNYCP